MLSANDFYILRFKVAKLLKTKVSKIKKIDISDDDMVLVHTGFGFFPISFKSIDEINSEFKKFCPDTKVPTNFKDSISVSPCKLEPIQKDKNGLRVLSTDIN